jgi:hypothetical protein
LQVLELIIFAGLAAIVLYQLYSVLGRRVGRSRRTSRAGSGSDPIRVGDRTGLAAERRRRGALRPGRGEAKDPGFDITPSCPARATPMR